MKKKVAILQSNYIPWKGYFDMIAAVDQFIIYDDAQFTKNDWRNRNKIKTSQGVQWLSIPVGQKISRRIRDVALPPGNWRRKHWNSLVAAYGRSHHFKDVASWLEPVYQEGTFSHLSAFNQHLIKQICHYLDIKTVLSNSSEFQLVDGRTRRLVDLCAKAGATEYISGPAARDYLDIQCFNEKGITVNWFDYAGYPEYPQLWGQFTHEVSILDLLFNCGRDSAHYMRYL